MIVRFVKKTVDRFFPLNGNTKNKILQMPRNQKRSWLYCSYEKFPQTRLETPWEVIPNWSVVIRSTGSEYECPVFKRKPTIRTEGRFGCSSAESKTFSTIVDLGAIVVLVGRSESIIFIRYIDYVRISIPMVRYFYDSMESLIR